MPDIEADKPLSAEDAAEADRLLELAESLGIEPFDLDDYVHDAADHYASDECNTSGVASDDEASYEIYEDAGRQAADINNGGLDHQISYLVAQYGSVGVEEIIREAASCTKE